MITGINEWKTLTKHILCKFDSRKCKSGITINVSASVKKTLSEYKNIMFGILLHVIVKMVNILQVLLTIQRLSVMKLWKKQKQFQQI